MEYTGQNGSGSDAVLTENISQDEEAYRRSLKGDAKAAEMLVERYGDALTFYVNGYIHDMHEAEDIMIEAFAQMFAKERPVTRKGSFRAYIYKTARNLALRHKRRSKEIHVFHTYGYACMHAFCLCKQLFHVIIRR